MGLPGRGGSLRVFPAQGDSLRVLPARGILAARPEQQVVICILLGRPRKLSISFVGCFKFAGEGYREVALSSFLIKDADKYGYCPEATGREALYCLQYTPILLAEYAFTPRRQGGYYPPPQEIAHAPTPLAREIFLHSCQEQIYVCLTKKGSFRDIKQNEACFNSK